MGKKIETTIIIGGKIAESLQKAFNTVSKNSDSLEKAFDSAGKVGAKAFSAVAKSVVAIGTSLVAVTEMTRDYRKDLAKMYNNAELAGVAQKEAWSGLEDLYAMSGEFDSANEAMSNLLATGYKGKDLTKIIEAVNGATIKWQDTVTQESLADAINETVMSGKSMGQFDEILSRSGVRIEEFNDGLLACNGLAERQQYVLSWLANSGLTEVNAKYQEQNKSLVEAYKADLAFKDSLAELAKIAEPVVTLFKNFASGALSYFAQKVKGIDLDKMSSALQKVGELGKQAFDAIWNALSKIDWETLIDAAVVVLEIFTGLFNFVISNGDVVTAVIAGIVSAMVAYKAIMLVTKGIQIASTIANALYLAGLDLVTGGTRKSARATLAAALAQGSLNLAFLACPITWIVLGIAAIVTAFVLLWNKSEAFRNFWKTAWDAIKNAFDVVKNGIVSGFSTIKGWIEKVEGWIDSLLDKLGVAGDVVKKVFEYSPVGLAAKGIKWVANKVTGNAEGSTISSPTLTWVGEGGDTETIVPHNSKPRSQALALEAVKGTGVSVGGNTFVFSPTVNVNGGSTEDVRGILEDEFNKFKAKMEAWVQGERRLSY